jgi:ABC-type sugar transport system ATPase subunit
VLQAGAPEEIYSRPVSPAVARLLGQPPINVLDARAEGGWWLAADGTQLARTSASAARARLGVRPEHVELAGGTTEGVVEVVEDAGAARVLLIRWAGTHVHALTERATAARAGDRVKPRLDPERVVVWPAE